MSPVQKRIHDAALRLFAGKSIGEVNVSELAQVAGVSRGTIYNNLSSIESLFENVVAQLSSEMNLRVAKSAHPDMDPAQRLSNGIRFYMRRTHEEPYWGRFIVRYAATSATLQDMWSGPPVQDVLSGLALHRYDFRQEQLASVVAMIGGVALTGMLLVLEGHKTWRDAGSDAAELILRALGIGAKEAQAIATKELPALPPP
ncbi:TetR/AcrR family transcriptional regulator [Pseudomonas sp. BN102]|uniref:TetR/AcrR family transcriptional regulator n=1 Tax=Pseudomonas sp. BN102 TaxID=2567886 RepID=UPI002458699E|nr:TetR/AcrR family transcriptional regulator [Pseudomonas sp. BN102]MDH4607479.1 TetR/AcrR family transcriptional regulator [Pseudomonas sp. BN102]